MQVRIYIGNPVRILTNKLRELLFKEKVVNAYAQLRKQSPERMKKRLKEGKLRFQPLSEGEMRKEMEDFIKEGSWRYVRDPETGEIVFDEKGKPKVEKCIGEAVE